MDRPEDGSVDMANEAFHVQLQQLENIVRELGSKGEIGEDPGWIQEYVNRIYEVGEALGNIATAREDLNPSHKSYR